MGGGNISLLELFRLGGFFMWPLLFFSIATVTIVLERAIYLIYHNLALGDLKQEVIACWEAGAPEQAEAFLERNARRRLGARVLLALVRGLRSGRFSGARLEKAVEAEALNCINTLETGLNFLTALGSISPLTGFLGTVSGMIGAFRAIAEATEVNAQIVASGIYEALITTVFGLIIAIIAMVAHSLFSHLVDKFAADTEKTCSDLFLRLDQETPRRREMRI